MYPAQPLQHQLQFLTPQQQHALIHVQAQQNATSPGDMDNRRLRMLFSSRNLVPGRDGQSTGFTEIVPSVGQSLQNMCLPMQRTETDMLMKKIAALQQQQPSNNLQQLLQHPLLSQQQQSSTYLEGEQEKMGAGIVTVAFAGNEQVSKNRNGRKRKHPISSSGPANSSGTTNTAGASPSSTPSTLSAHSPGETISTPLQHQNASSCTTLVVYGSEGPVPIGSPTNQLVDMDHYTEDDSMEDNLEPFLPHNGTNPRAAGSHCISSGKGLWPILYDYLFSQTLRYLDTGI
ncbi:Transcriptional corepressor LEUNIG [Zea mays]|nr:Transcriptional corepressor LEUNIG [Zea mays]